MLTCKISIEKEWLAGGANRGQNASRYRVMSQSYFVPHLENHAQYTCLRVAEVVIFEVELSDRWVVGFQLGHWDATELLQRLALLLSNMTSPMEKHINYKETQIALTTATWASLAATSPLMLELSATLMLLIAGLP